MEGSGLASKVLAVVKTDVGDVVAEVKDVASNPDADEVNEEPLAIAVEVTNAEVASDTYLWIVEEHFVRLDYSSTDSVVRQKFLPLALRLVTQERALQEAGKIRTSVDYSLLVAVAPIEVELSAVALR